MELVLYPDPRLRKRSAPLAAIDDAVVERVEAMVQVMYREKGIGLAAPQVGWAARVFVTNVLGEDHPEGEQVFINPALISSEGEETEEEGCLSIPEVRGRVARASRVLVEAQDLRGQAFRRELEGLAARAFQHELDHLDGILIISRLSAAERLLVNKQLKSLEREYRKRSASQR
jgi:peptide deformylase